MRFGMVGHWLAGLPCVYLAGLDLSLCWHVECGGGVGGCHPERGRADARGSLNFLIRRLEVWELQPF